MITFTFKNANGDTVVIVSTDRVSAWEALHKEHPAKFFAEGNEKYKIVSQVPVE